MKEEIKIELGTYTNLEVLARKEHTTVWLCILDAVRRKAGNDSGGQDEEDWWKRDC
jgi:hypothetical protein